MLTEPIKQKIKDLFQSTPDYVGVGWGNKISDNQHTGERSIVFNVTKKLPLSEIPEEEHLPSTVEIDGVTYKTDVVEVGEIVTFSCPTTTLNSCYSWTDFYFNEYTGGPTYGGGGATPPANRGTIRPMQGGISITSQNQLGKVGTLGFLAVDNEKNALVGVTNNHVVIGDAFFTTYRTSTNLNEYQDQYYQPGESGFQGNANYVVGEVVRYVPINPSPATNLVDGALVTIDPSKVTNAESYKLYVGGAARATTDADGLPMEYVANFSYMNFGSRTDQKYMTEMYSEGYIDVSTDVQAVSNFETNGCGSIVSFDIDGEDTNYVCLPTGGNSFGKSSFGSEPVGGYSSENLLGLPPKFRLFSTTVGINFHEVQPRYYALGTNINFQLLAFGYDVVLSKDKNIKNKN